MSISIIKFILQAESPNNSELNALAEYLLWSLAFVIWALLESAFVILLRRASLYLRNDTKDMGISKKVVPVITTERTQIIRYTEDKDTLMQRRKNTNGFNSDNEQGVVGSKRQFCIIPWLGLIDFLSLLISVSLFLAFNCIYWNKYYV